MEDFSPSEQYKLAPYFTNLTEPIFGLKLPQEIAGALFSRYSRSSKSLRRIFLDEFLGHADLPLQQLPGSQMNAVGQGEALKKAREFYDRVLVGYGDDSVAQLGGAHVACERISNVAAKLLEDARIGVAPLEKSTRYVRFDQTGPDGDYLFYKEPKIMASPHRGEYLAVMRLLFETYAAQMEPMIAFVRDSLPVETVEWKHPQTGEPLTYKEAGRDEQLRRWADTAYRSTVRAQACDILRSYLPAATLTNVGVFGVGQAFEHLLNKLYSHALFEAQFIASGVHESLNHLIPSFVKRARRSDYLAETYAAVRSLAAQFFAPTPVTPSQPVTLVDYDPEAEEKILAAILYPHTRHPLLQLRRAIAAMAPAQREQILSEYLHRRRHRRDKPGRALENVFYTFDFIGNLGLYRDLHRHRLLTQERQDFTTEHGYDTPDELDAAGFKPVFERCMEAADQLYRRLRQDLPYEAQYAVPFAYRIRWYMKMNLREAVHIGELRTMPQGHPDYRLMVQEMWKQIAAVHPTLARAAAFIDWRTYRLGRLQSELRSEYKREAVSSQQSAVSKTHNQET
ncbi:MAG TPA: FAD-dependent thymidylate synthase [Methylomirabilota bacterium]|nr:FAD-dependent thymidylate synthase [Methylomirabilota bacterium]